MLAANLGGGGNTTTAFKPNKTHFQAKTLLTEPTKRPPLKLKNKTKTQTNKKPTKQTNQTRVLKYKLFEYLHFNAHHNLNVP